MLKRLFTINFVDAFIVGVVTVLVPLLMLSRGIDIATIGLIFAIAPLAKIIIRFGGAAVADSFGDRIVYVLGSLCDFIQSAIYLVSGTAAGFAAGKLFEGARESLIWSVNRPSLMAAAPEKKHFVTAAMSSGRFAYNALGSLAVGILFAWGGFGMPLLAIALLSAYLVYSSLRLKNAHRAQTRFHLADFSPFGKGRKFYEIAGVLTLGTVFYSAVFYMLLPLYFRLQGFSISEIGLFYAGYFLIQGAALHALSHIRMKTVRAAALGSVTYVVGMAGVIFAGHPLVPFFFLFMAIGDGCLSILWEEMNYLAAVGSKKRATDLSLIIAPGLLFGMVVTGISGVAVAMVGFAPIFALCALSMLGFAAWCTRLAAPAKK